MEIEALQISLDAPERFKMVRKFSESEIFDLTAFEPSLFAEAASIIDRACSRDTPTGSLISKFKQSSNFETAEALRRIRVANASIESDSTRPGRLAYLAGLGVFQSTLGNFDGVVNTCDEILLLLSNSSVPFQRSSEREVYEYLDVLESIDQERAEALYLSLIDTCEHKRIGGYRYSEYRFRYAEFLSKQNRSEEVSQVIEQLMVSEGHSPDRYAWIRMGDIFKSLGDLNRAIACYEKAAEWYQSKTPQSQAGYDKSRPYAFVMLRLIVAHLQNGDNLAACASVDKLLEPYKQFDETTIVRIEQRASFFPSYSEVLIASGDAYLLASNPNRAEHCYEQAISVREHALGPQNALIDAARLKSIERNPTRQDIERLIDVTRKKSSRLPELAALKVWSVVRQGQLNSAKILVDEFLNERSELTETELLTVLALSRAFDNTTRLAVLQSVWSKCRTQQSVYAIGLLAHLSTAASLCGDQKTADRVWNELMQLPIFHESPAENRANASRSFPGLTSTGGKIRILGNIFRINKQFDVAHHVLLRAEMANADSALLNCDRAILLASEGRLQEARTFWKKVLRLPLRSPLVDKLIELATILESVGSDYDQEEVLTAAATATDRVDAVIKLAVFYNSCYRFPESESLLTRVVVSRNELVEQRIKLAESLAESLAKQGKTAAALEVYHSILILLERFDLNQRQTEKQEILFTIIDLQEKSVGPDSAALVPSLEKLIDAFQHSGNLNEAAKVIERLAALKSNSSDHESEDPDVLKRLAQQYIQSGDIEKYVSVSRRLAFIYHRQNKDVEAMQRLLSAIERQMLNGHMLEALQDMHLLLEWENQFGYSHCANDSRLVCGEYNNFIETLIKNNLLDEAEGVINHAIEVREKVYGASSEQVATVLTHLISLKQAKKSDFQESYLRILQIYAENGGQYTSLSTGGYVPFGRLEQLAYRMASDREFKQAISLVEPLAALQNEYGCHLSLADTLGALGSFYEQDGNFEKSEMCLKRAWQIQLKHLGREHHVVHGLRDRLHQVLLKLGKIDEAEELMLNSQQLSLGEVMTVSKLSTLFNVLPFKNEVCSPSEWKAIGEEVLQRQDLLSKDTRDVLKALRVGLSKKGLLGREYLDIQFAELDILKQTCGHYSLEAISATQDIALVFHRLGDSDAAKIWTGRAIEAAQKLHKIADREVLELLAIADKFSQLFEPDLVSRLLYKFMNHFEREKIPGFQGHARRCCEILRSCGLSAQADEFEAKSKNE